MSNLLWSTTVALLLDLATAARKVRDPLAIDNITLTPHAGFGPKNGDISDGIS